MHSENNDFMHGGKITGGKMRWIVVQFYKFEFVLTRQKLESLLMVEKRARTTTTQKITEKKR